MIIRSIFLLIVGLTFSQSITKNYDSLFVKHLFENELYQELEVYHHLKFLETYNSNEFHYNWAKSRILGAGFNEIDTIIQHITVSSTYYSQAIFLKLSTKFLNEGLQSSDLSHNSFFILPKTEQGILSLGTYHLLGDQTKVDSILKVNIEMKPYSDLWDKEMKMKRKSKFLAVLFGLFPGGGKMYVGNPKAGLATLMGVSFLSAHAIDAYNKKGVKNINFIGYSLLSSLFYIGSINGGVQQLEYNRKITHEKFSNFIRFNISISIADILSSN